MQDMLPDGVGWMHSEDDLLPLSALQQVIFYERQCTLLHVNSGIEELHEECGSCGACRCAHCGAA